MKTAYTFLTRRNLLKGSAAAAGALAYTASPAGGLFGRAHAQTLGEESAVLLVFLQGGYNALFGSADSFLGAGSFGVSSSNVRSLGNGLVIDAPTYGTLPTPALSRMASIGVNHGISSHGAAQMANWMMGTRSYPIALAASMGGDAPIRCAVVGSRLPAGTRPPEGGVTMQQITDVKSTIEALGGVIADPSVPNRAIAANGLVAGNAMSEGAFGAHPESLQSVSEGFGAGIATLQKPAQQLDYAQLASAYGVSTTATAVSSFTMQMLAAELMIQAGCKVVIAIHSGWDSHGDTSGTKVRTTMSNAILPGLRRFESRMMAAPGRNVVTAIFGDFSRSLPGSDHQRNLTATVIGKYVKGGTTGRVAANVSLPSGTPSVGGFWSYLAAVARAPQNPFGANPHALVL